MLICTHTSLIAHITTRIPEHDIPIHTVLHVGSRGRESVPPLYYGYVLAMPPQNRLKHQTVLADQTVADVF